MNERKINILHDIEYIDTISNDLSLENIEKFKLIKSTLDYLKKLKLIIPTKEDLSALKGLILASISSLTAKRLVILR